MQEKYDIILIKENETVEEARRKYIEKLSNEQLDLNRQIYFKRVFENAESLTHLTHLAAQQDIFFSSCKAI